MGSSYKILLNYFLSVGSHRMDYLIKQLYSKILKRLNVRSQNSQKKRT